MDRAVRAFTLLELLVSVALAGVITAAATTATMGVYDASLVLTQTSFAHEESKLITDLVSTELLQVGGGKIRPWAAVSNGCFVNEAGTLTAVNGGSCSGRGGTRLDIVDFAEGTEQVTIASATPTSLTVSKPASASCPLTPEKGFPAAGTNVVLFTSRTDAGGGFSGARCVPNTTTCTCALTALGGAGAITVPHQLTVTPVLTGGTMIVGQIITYERTGNSLFERRDFDGDGSVERRLISDRVFDFRVQFGHDAAPEDGIIDTLAGSWATSLDVRTDATVKSSSLRMARVGVIVGARVTKPNAVNGASLFGNPTVTAPRFSLRSAETAVTLRNLLVFF